MRVGRIRISTSLLYCTVSEDDVGIGDLYAEINSEGQTVYSPMLGLVFSLGIIPIGIKVGEGYIEYIAYFHGFRNTGWKFNDSESEVPFYNIELTQDRDINKLHVTFREERAVPIGRFPSSITYTFEKVKVVSSVGDAVRYRIVYKDSKHSKRRKIILDTE